MADAYGQMEPEPYKDLRRLAYRASDQPDYLSQRYQLPRQKSLPSSIDESAL